MTSFKVASYLIIVQVIVVLTIFQGMCIWQQVHTEAKAGAGMLVSVGGAYQRFTTVYSREPKVKFYSKYYER